MHDLVIRNATIVDGTGADRRTGDIAIDDGVFSEVGEVSGQGKREIDAGGDIVAPGWVDIHTHYDGQVTWDPLLSPSSNHGVTTAVMGNCGVGFAPVRPDGKDFLIELMESVEDIPGTALHEGIDWNWESFPEYLDHLDKMDRAIDVAAMMPHCALRAYVMGERAHDADTTEDDRAKMHDLTNEALKAGAVGFSTSRTILHRSAHGLVPGTHSYPDEIEAIGDGFKGLGHGVFQMATDHWANPAELEWMEDFTKRTGRTLSFNFTQVGAPDAYKEQLDGFKAWQDEGLNVIPQIACRPTGMLYGLQSSLHPFITHPSFAPLHGKPLAEVVQALKDPALKAQILSEKPAVKDPIALGLMTKFDQMFPLGSTPDYEPAKEASAAAVAQASGKTPEEVAYDWMLEDDGKALMFVPLAAYGSYDLSAVHHMIDHPATVMGLSDGGAHCGLICDASFPTYLLTHWARDRKRGPTFTLENVVKQQTKDTAAVYGMADRGTIEVGKKADLNIIDFDGLTLHAPHMVNDLPTGARRLVQFADGYRYTICSGAVTFENGQHTGALPGKLYRAS